MTLILRAADAYGWVCETIKTVEATIHLAADKKRFDALPELIRARYGLDEAEKSLKGHIVVLHRQLDLITGPSVKGRPQQG